jgi:aminoglycoside phosphotransferase (APT) family kinase protein
MSFDISLFEMVIAHFKLGPIYDLKPILLPTLHPAALMNSRFLIELSPDSHFENPVYALQLLADMPLPVPKVLHVDNSKQSFGFSIMIIEQETGTALEDCWAGMTVHQQRECAFKAGGYLAQSHRQGFSQYGALVDIQKGKSCTTWAEWVDAKAQWYLMLCEQAHLLPPLLLMRTKNKISASIESCRTVQKGALCHGGFDLSKVLTRRGQCIQLIHFDRSLSADPAWDFREYRNINIEVPGALSSLCEGYQCVRPFDDTFFERAEFYSLISELEHICLARHFLDDTQLQQATTRLKGLLDS